MMDIPEKITDKHEFNKGRGAFGLLALFAIKRHPAKAISPFFLLFNSHLEFLLTVRKIEVYQIAGGF